MDEYDNESLWVRYTGGATFIRVCEKCGRFVKAYKKITLNGLGELSDRNNGRCKKCGKTKMIFQGFIWTTTTSTIMAKYSRSDNCQKTIVLELRQMGARVCIVSQFHIGFDIIVGWFGIIGLFELKNTDKDKMTVKEIIFSQEWNGYVHRAKSSEEIRSIMSGIIADRKF